MDSRRQRVAITFRDRDTFGRGCLALNEGNVPFTLAGAYTVVVAEKELTAWSEKFPELVRGFLAGGSARIIEAGREAKRPALPTEKETEEVLWKLSKIR